MRRRHILDILLTLVALIAPAVVQSQDTTEATDSVAVEDVQVKVVELSDLDLSCAIWISHSNVWFHLDEDESIVDITCVYDVDIADDRKIERSRIKACRSELKERNHCWGDDSRDFLRKARMADFAASYEERSEGGEISSSDVHAFTMTVRARIDLER